MRPGAHFNCELSDDDASVEPVDDEGNGAIDKSVLPSDADWHNAQAFLFPLVCSVESLNF